MPEAPALSRAADSIFNIIDSMMLAYRLDGTQSAQLFGILSDRARHARAVILDAQAVIDKMRGEKDERNG